MSDRPTPETDDIALGNHVVPPEWAQQLECERDEARERAAKWESSFDAMERAGAEQARRADENREWALRAERERDEAREKLSAAWQSLRDSQDEVLRLTFENRSLSQELDKAREALKRIYQASMVAQSLEEDFAEWEKAIEMLLVLIKKEAH